MKKVLFLLSLFLLVFALAQLNADDEVVGKRPYEMDWAGRVDHEDPPFVDFENLDGWVVNTHNAVAQISRTREQQIWGKYVGKLVYRAVDDAPSIDFGPPAPIPIEFQFDAVSCWVYGNNWGWAPDPEVPPAHIAIILEGSDGAKITVNLDSVNWKEWHLMHRRLTPEQIDAVANGAKFVGFHITNCNNKKDLNLFFDNLSFFAEQFQQLAFPPRKLRGIPMFPGQGVGINTGPGKLPFPNSEKTILPSNLVKDFKTTLKQEGDTFLFTYEGSDGTLAFRLSPSTGTFSDIRASWNHGKPIYPCIGGGALLAVGRTAVVPDTIEPIGKPTVKNDEVTLQYRLTKGNISVDVAYTYRLWNKSLVIDTVALGGNVAEVVYGHAEGITNPRLVKNPYYRYGGNYPVVVVSGPVEEPLFLTGHTDWYLSNATIPYANNAIKDGEVTYQGGVRYIPKTDNMRNDCFERFFITISPRYEEILPNIPNPVSPWKHVTGTGVWRAHHATNRENDAAFWRNVYRHGLRKVIITDHESGWRDGGESFTFRTRTAPGKGGDKGQYDYARILQDELGYVYGPYNNFTDFAPVNEFWNYDVVTRLSDKQLQRAWMRCYAPKPLRAVEYCELLAPQIQAKFQFSTAYCDVHTAVAPWDRVDFDARVPGAGTFTTTFYSFGEIMLLQKAAWSGPVYSEGNNHLWYCGLTDGNYGQDGAYNLPDNPWLVDIDLRKMHDLCCNFGMGYPYMFYGQVDPGPTALEKDAYYDRMLAATVAFGHPAFLTFEGGFQNALRSYFMLQQLHADYTQVSVARIQYADENGNLLDTSAAVASGAYTRNHIVVTYENGTVTVVNGNRTERFKALGLDLPPNGYAGWTKDKSVYVISGDDPDHHRTDYADTPEYIFVDGRGKFTQFDKAASDGIGICRFMEDGKYEVIPYEGADCGFKIDVNTAVALDKDFKEIGAARLRRSRGYVFIEPVEGAVSYVLSKTSTPAAINLTSERLSVVPGEQVLVRGNSEHTITIPADTAPGTRLWFELEGGWIDFVCTEPSSFAAELDGNMVNVSATSHLSKPEPFNVRVGDVQKQVTLQPGIKTSIVFDLGGPTEVSRKPLLIEVSSAAGSVKREYILESLSVPAIQMQPDSQFKAHICFRGSTPVPLDETTGAVVISQARESGGVKRDGIFIHPPYIGGVGYTFVTFPPLVLPGEPAFVSVMVGKIDGSHLGDGVLFKLALVDENENEHILARRTVAEYNWFPIEADISQWAGKKVSIRLISDVGVDDDSVGDWSAWSDVNIGSVRKKLIRTMRADDNEG